MTSSVLAPARRGHVPRAARPLCLPGAARAGAARAGAARVLVVGAGLCAADVPGLCARLRLLIAGSGARVLPCDVSAVRCPDAGTLDALARLQLAAHRLGAEIRLRHVSGNLAVLLAITGLADVLPSEGPTAAGAGRTAGTGARCRGTRASR